MELNLSQNMRKILTLFILIILPVLILLIIFAVDYKQMWYYYVLIVTWLGLGVIFYGSME